MGYSPQGCRVRHDLVPKEQHLYTHLYLDIHLCSYRYASVHAYSVAQTCLNLCQQNFSMESILWALSIEFSLLDAPLSCYRAGYGVIKTYASSFYSLRFNLDHHCWIAQSMQLLRARGRLYKEYNLNVEKNQSNQILVIQQLWSKAIFLLCSFSDTSAIV